MMPCHDAIPWCQRHARLGAAQDHLRDRCLSSKAKATSTRRGRKSTSSGAGNSSVNHNSSSSSSSSASSTITSTSISTSSNSTSSSSNSSSNSADSRLVGKKRPLFDGDGDVGAGAGDGDVAGQQLTSKKRNLHHQQQQQQHHLLSSGDAGGPSSSSSSSSSSPPVCPSEPLRKFGLQSLVEHYLGLPLAKPRSVRLSNWEVIELTDAQVDTTPPPSPRHTTTNHNHIYPSMA